MSVAEAKEQPPVAEPLEAEAPADDSLERLLEHVAEEGAPEATAPAVAPSAAQELAAAPAEAPPPLRTARIVSMKGGGVQIAWRGRSVPIEAELCEGVDSELVERAMKNGDAVLVEVDPVEGPLVVGVVQTRLPETLELKANKIVIEGESEVLLRSGRAAVRLREDGDVEMVGSRILSMSRGLYRIVGRVLRLN
jgi:hypothetical protein